MRKDIGASWKVKEKRGVRLKKPDAPPCRAKPEIKLVPAHGLPYNCSGLNGG